MYTYKTKRDGFTLIEMTLSIVLMIGLVGIGLKASSVYINYSKGKRAGANLRSCYYLQQEINTAFNSSSFETLGVANAKEAVAVYKFQDVSTADALDKLDDFYRIQYKGEPHVIQITALNEPPIYHNENNGTALSDPSGSKTDNVYDTGVSFTSEIP